MSIDSPTIADDPSVLRLSVGGRVHELHALWLRDACQCDSCRRPSTNERLLDSTTIESTITIESATVEADALVLVHSDGHRAMLSTDWLLAHLSRSNPADTPAVEVALWHDATDLELRSFAFADLADPQQRLAWLDTIAESGVALLRGAPTTNEALVETAAHIGEIRATNYGVTWEIEATIEPVSAVDSQRHLLVHTDLPYRTTAPGLQLLLAAVADVAGGASTLVDGYAAAERLRANAPAAWSLLTTTEFGYPFVRDTVELVGRAPLIGLRPDGRYFQIRRAPDLVGSPFVGTAAGEAAKIPALYRAMTLWASELDEPRHEFELRLEPGDLLAFDNHRLLHGRTAFELGATGRRNLKGCYLDKEDLDSARRVLRRTVEAS